MNRIDVWELFMSSNLDVKLNLTLGSDVLINPNKCDADNIAIIFDNFCKSYTKRAWKLRADLRNWCLYMYLFTAIAVDYL